MDRGAWLVIVHKVAELDKTEMTQHTPGLEKIVCYLTPCGLEVMVEHL